MGLNTIDDMVVSFYRPREFRVKGTFGTCLWVKNNKNHVLYIDLCFPTGKTYGRDLKKRLWCRHSFFMGNSNSIKYNVSRYRHYIYE